MSRTLRVAGNWATGLQLLVITAWAGLPASCATAAPLRVVSYNLQGMRPDSNWQVRMFFIEQRLRQLDPDIVLLQEVCQAMDGDGSDNQARTLAEDLAEHFDREYHWSFCPSHVAWDQFDEGVGIISRWPVLEDDCHALANGTFPRRVAWQRVDTPDGEVQVFSTHLEHMSNQGAVRLLQARQARDFVLGKLAQYPGSGAILGGDFNTTPGTPPILVFTVAGVDSVFAEAWASTHPGEPGYTVPAEAPTSRIDFQFGLRQGDPWAPDSSRIVFDGTYDGSHTLSDHLGLLAVYDLPVTGIGSPAPFLRDFRLLPPWPNPFNPETRFEVELARSTPAARLALFDLLGRPVATLHDGPLASGLHGFRWDGSGQPAGLYLIRMTVGSRSEAVRALYLP